MGDYPETDARGRKLTAMQSAILRDRIPFDELVVGHLYLLRGRRSPSVSYGPRKGWTGALPR